MTTGNGQSGVAEIEGAVAQFIEEHGLLPKGAPVTVAVSGGGDSVALLHILSGLAAAGARYRLSVAHLNHQLRPGAAEEDEAFVRRLAGTLRLPYRGEARDVKAIARERRLNLEAAARAVRYEFLEHAAEELGAGFVAVGHTRDDKLETVLWRLQRDDDLHHLAAMAPSRPIREGSEVVLVRPSLAVGRQALRDYLRARGVPWRTDHTNRELSRTRNRIRHQLLPVLREKLGEEYLAGVLELAGEVGALDRQVRTTVDDLLAKVARRSEQGLFLPVAWLQQLPEEFRGAVLYRALREVELLLAPPGRFLDSRLTRHHVAAVQAAVGAGGPVLVDQLPGDLVAEVTGTELHLGGRREEQAPPVVAARPLPQGDGRVNVPELGLQVAVRELLRHDLDWQAWLRTKARAEDMLDAEALRPRSELVLRTRRPGDRFHPLGAPGGRKLKDFFIDHKVPRGRRDCTLLLARGSEVLWVAGLAVSDRVKVHARSGRLLHVAVGAK